MLTYIILTYVPAYGIQSGHSKVAYLLTCKLAYLRAQTELALQVCACPDCGGARGDVMVEGRRKELRSEGVAHLLKSKETPLASEEKHISKALFEGMSEAIARHQR